MRENRQRGKSTPEKGPRWGGAGVEAAGREAKRLLILETAAKLFKERGFEAVSLDDVAAALNVTKPMIYYYVGNKEEILVSIRHLAAERLTAGLDEELASTKSGLEILQLLLLRYGAWTTSDIGRCALRLITVRLSPKNARELRAIEKSFEAQVNLIFERGFRDGSLKACNVSMVSMALFGAFNWMACWHDDSRDSLDTEQITRLFIELFAQGLETPVSTSRPALIELTATCRTRNRRKAGAADKDAAAIPADRH